MKLVLATDEQKRARDQATFESWGKLLKLKQYLEREHRLRTHPWALEEMRTWLLCDEGGAVLSSCETFRMDAFVGGGPERFNAYAVASVYTETALRGQRHALRMLELLHERLLAEDARARAVVLYSDVDERIYARAGYTAPRPAFDLVFTPEVGDAAKGVDALVAEAGLAEALARVPRPVHPFVIWPSAAQLDWALERERLYAALLRRRRPGCVGARVGGSTALWAVNGKGDLHLLVLDAEGPREASALLRAARRAAVKGGARAVHLWEAPLPFPWPGLADGGRREPRDGGLPMLHPLDAQVRPEGWGGVCKGIWV